MHAFPIVVGLLSIVGSLTAQTATSTLPLGYVNTEGNGLFGHPWYWTNARTLTLLGWKSIPSGLRTVRGLRVRPDAGVSSMAAKSLTVEVAMSNRGVVATVPPFSTVWSKHYGTDRKIVMRRRTIRLPAATKPATAPHAWTAAMALPFDAPWLRSGTTLDALCIDCKTWSPTTQSSLWYADAYAPGKYGSSLAYGQGCPTSATYFGGHQYQGSVNGFYTFGYSRGLGDICLAWIGSGKTSLPFGSYRSSPCTLYTLPLIIHGSVITTTSTTGYASRWTWIKPVPASLVGARFQSQMVAFTRIFEMKTTHAIDVEVGPGTSGSFRQGTVYNLASGTTAFDPDKSPARYLSNQVTIFGVY
mgnify:CR=1 FL=1